MKVTCQRESLLSAFQAVAAVAPARSPKTILQNVKLEVSENSAILLATDLEVGIRHVVENFEVERPGAAILPVARFGSILRESTSETMVIDVTDRGITVLGDRSKFNLSSIDPEEFPPIETFDEKEYIEVSTRLMKELIRRTLFATDSESSRYALGGVLLEIEKDRMTAVATDGRRLAKMEGPIISTENYKAPEGTVIVPARAMQLLDRSLSDSGKEIKIAVRANDIIIQGEHSTLFARLQEGRFPDWRKVFPQHDHPIRLEIPVGPFHTSVRQAAIITSEESRGVLFTFTSGALVLSGQAKEVGQSRIELPIAYEGDDVTVKLDPRYVADFLKVLGADKNFTIEIKDDNSAVLCYTEDGFGYVIMPLANDR